jgi:hypothetical protein
MIFGQSIDYLTVCVTFKGRAKEERAYFKVTERIVTESFQLLNIKYGYESHSKIWETNI